MSSEPDDTIDAYRLAAADDLVRETIAARLRGVPMELSSGSEWFDQLTRDLTEELKAGVPPSRVLADAPLDPLERALVVTIATVIHETVQRTPWYVERLLEACDRERPEGRRTDCIIALSVLVQQRWAPHEQIRLALRRRASENGRTEDQERAWSMSTGVQLAVGELIRPQTHRFGKDWITDAVGKRASFVPADDLPTALLWRLFVDEARTAAVQTALGQPYPSARYDVLDAETHRRRDGSKSKAPAVVAPDDALDDPATVDPLAALIDEEAQQEAQHLHALLVGVATPRQREIMNLLASGMTAADAARQLDLQPSSVREHISRLRARVAGLRGESPEAM